MKYIHAFAFVIFSIILNKMHYVLSYQMEENNIHPFKEMIHLLKVTLWE
jgi:hypothetical protein